MSSQSYLHLPAFWHFSCYQWTGTRWRCPVSTTATVVILVIITFFVFLYFSRHSSFIEPIRVQHHGRHTNIVTRHGDGSMYHYGAVIDCGSSGSRLFIYTWPTHTGVEGELLNIRHLRDGMSRILVKKISPGLSSLSNRPDFAGKHIRPLLEYASRHIPRMKLSETPLYILATAGLRMLKPHVRESILHHVRREVKLNYQFLFNDNHVEVISGKQEGIFAWIAVNYVLGRFHHEDEEQYRFDDESGKSPSGKDREPFRAGHSERDESSVRAGHSRHVRKATVGIIDMGGGSAQLAYEVGKSESLHDDLLAEFNLGCRNTDGDHLFRIYVTTFPGFGANSARTRYDRLLTADMLISPLFAANTSVNHLAPVSNDTLSDGSSKTSGNKTSPAILDTSLLLTRPPIRTVKDPCLPIGLNQTIVRNNTQITIQGSGNFTTCRQSLVPLLNLSSTCGQKSCTMNDLHLAPINFTSSEFIGFSEYFYSTEGLLNNDGFYQYSKYQGASEMYCSTHWTVIEQRYRPDLFNRATNIRRRSQCFKSAWITEFLHHGLHFPPNYSKFRPVLKIEDHEIQWTLGALLYKTRYFPLREVQRMELSRVRHAWKHTWFSSTVSQYFLTTCIILVLLSIILYLRRLRRILSRDVLSRDDVTPSRVLSRDVTAPSSGSSGTSNHHQYFPKQSLPSSFPEEVVVIQGEIFK